MYNNRLTITEKSTDLFALLFPYFQGPPGPPGAMGPVGPAGKDVSF